MGAVIVEAVRTPVGKKKGGLSGVHPADLSALVLNELVTRAGLAPELVNDVIWGCVGQVGEQTFDLARTAVLSAGWPETVPGVTIDRQCGSSQQAMNFAVASVLAGHYDAVVAGGVESMSRITMGLSTSVGGRPYGPKFQERYGADPNQGVGAEMMAEKWDISRTETDVYAVAFARSGPPRRRTPGCSPTRSSPITNPDGAVIAADEGIRRGTSVESLGRLKPVFKENGVIHAGNSSQISDGAAALLVVSDEFAQRHGLTPIARVHTAVVAGADPVMMLSAPIPATQQALAKSGLALSDIGVFEVNEAFAPVPMAWQKEIGADDELLNPNGGAIALGHPLGGSGARIMTDLVYHMRRNDIRYGLQTMCEGGGQANATILELVK